MRGLFKLLFALVVGWGIWGVPVGALAETGPLGTQIAEYNNAFGKPVLELPYHNVPLTAPGWEERGPEFRKWLAPSVRIGGGSGTMVYYDPKTGWMYVISCGHLFDRGRKSSEDYEKTGAKKTIEIFYQNNKKLNMVRKYEAEVIAHVWGDNNSSVFDVSLMRFKPDWKDPWCLPIAPVNFKYERGKYYHSCGCDGRSEVAHYLVQFVEERDNGTITEVVTEKNGPRGGRSGGGVFTDDGQLIGICSRGGGGYGYWTSLNQIHKFLKEEGFDFIIGTSAAARLIPIVDTDRPDQKFPSDYIPIPSNAGEPLPTEIAPHLAR